MQTCWVFPEVYNINYGVCVFCIESGPSSPSKRMRPDIEGMYIIYIYLLLCKRTTPMFYYLKPSLLLSALPCLALRHFHNCKSPKRPANTALPIEWIFMISDALCTGACICLLPHS